MQIDIIPENKETIYINSDTSISIQKIKEEISITQKIPINSIQLTFDGKHL